jgi:hypothetical protein
MKFILFALIMIGVFLNVSSTFKADDLFQVISSHPHDVEELAPYIETVHQEGRLWIVQLKADLPLELMAHLAPLKGGETSYIRDEESIFFNVSRQGKDPAKALVSKINVAAIKSDVEDLANNYVTRFAGTAENKRAFKSVSERFKKLGYTISEVCHTPDICGLVADKKGSTKPNQVIMVVGHLDSVGESFAGADDNASGVAVMLEMARVLKDIPNRKTIRFFVTNDEEQNMKGSTFYTKKLEAKKELKNLELVINMDMVAYNANGVVEVETEPEHEELAKWFADLAFRYTKLKTKITLGAWGSDHVPFLNRGVPSVMTVENWDTKTPCYHLECDKPDTLNYEYAGEIAKLNTSAVYTKDQE